MKKGLFLAVVGVVAMAAVANAAPDFTLTAPTLEYDQLGAFGTAIMSGLAAMWLLRKGVKTLNRS